MYLTSDWRSGYTAETGDEIHKPYSQRKLLQSYQLQTQRISEDNKSSTVDTIYQRKYTLAYKYIGIKWERQTKNTNDTKKTKL